MRQAEALVAQRLKKTAPKPATLPGSDPNKIYRDAAAKALTDRFGRKVTICSAAGGKGRVEMAYYNDDDLSDLLDLLEQVKVSAKAKGAKGGSKA